MQRENLGFKNYRIIEYIFLSADDFKMKLAEDWLGLENKSLVNKLINLNADECLTNLDLVSKAPIRRPKWLKYDTFQSLKHPGHVIQFVMHQSNPRCTNRIFCSLITQENSLINK